MKNQTPKGAIHALNAMAGRKDTSEVLKSFKNKVLIITGLEDEITPIEIAKEMEQLTSEATLKIIESAGHLSNFENPHRFNQILMEWIKTF